MINVFRCLQLHDEVFSGNPSRLANKNHVGRWNILTIPNNIVKMNQEPWYLNPSKYEATILIYLDPFVESDCNNFELTFEYSGKSRVLRKPPRILNFQLRFAPIQPSQHRVPFFHLQNSGCSSTGTPLRSTLDLTKHQVAKEGGNWTLPFTGVWFLEGNGMQKKVPHLLWS